MASTTRSDRFRQLCRKIRSTRVSITFTTVDKEAKETQSSGKKLTAGGEHGNGIANSIPISDFTSEEDFIQLKASDLGSLRTLDSDKEKMEVLPQPKKPIALDQKVDTNGQPKEPIALDQKVDTNGQPREPIALDQKVDTNCQPKEPIAFDQKVDTNGGRKDSSKMNSDGVQLITDNQSNVDDEASEEDFIQLKASDLGSLRTLDSDKEKMEVLPQPKEPIALDQKVDTNGGRKDSSKINSDGVQLITDNQSNVDDEPSASIEARNVLNDNPSTSRGSKAENGELVVQASAEEIYMIESELSHEATQPIVEHKNAFQTVDGSSNYLSFAIRSHLCQTINEAKTYDPGRIPSYVFSRHRNSMDVEWSVASNESMFSIQVESSSFSRDHAFSFGKSGELNGFISGPGNSITSETDTASRDQSSDICSDQSAAPAAIMQETIHNDLEPEKTSPVREQQPKAHAIPSPQHAAVVEEKIVGGGNLPTTLAVPRTTSMSRPSDSSGASTHSFAFPILTAGSKNASVKVQDEAPVRPPAFPQVKPVEHHCWWSCFQCSCPSCC